MANLQIMQEPFLQTMNKARATFKLQFIQKMY